MTVRHLEHTLEHVEQTVAPLGAARMERDDADLIRRELAWVADALRLACGLAEDQWLDVMDSLGMLDLEIGDIAEDPFAFDTRYDRA